MSNNIIELENVVKNYRLGKTEVKALRGLTMKVEKGDFIAIMGPSGCGKSTLLNMIGCLDKPTQGKVLFEGRDTSPLNSNQLAELRKNKTGFIFQHFNLIPVLTALENIELPLLLTKTAKDKLRGRVKEILEKVGLEDKANHRPLELSGGEQQRVAIARALAPIPDIVLADEPTGDLDSEMGQTIIRLMKTLNEVEGSTFVFTSHDPAIIEHAKRVIRLRDGMIVE